MSPRIKKKILQYSLISKVVGIIDQEEWNQIINHLKARKQDTYENN